MIIFTGHTMPRHWQWVPASVLKIPWLQFPFRGGWAALDIFFWISGYTVTYKLVGLMQARKSDKLLDALSSSIFRRYFRLFLPVLPVTLLTVLTVQIGMAIPPEDRANKIVGNPLLWWIKDSGHQLNPFTPIKGYWDGQTGSELLDPFWSLGAEFRSSMMMFTFCAGSCKLSTRTRKALLLLSVPAFIAWQAQWAAMAFLGMWFAEGRQEQKALQPQKPVLQEEKILPNSSGVKQERPLQRIQPLRRWALLALFLYSFVVLKDPYDTAKMTLFPHNYLNMMVPDYWHPQMRMHMHLLIGSMMMLYPLDQLAFLQRPLLTTFSQFLGELSFGIYAVHFSVRWIVWEPRYVKWAVTNYGDKAFDDFWIAFAGWTGMAIVVIWAAEMFRRLDWKVVTLLHRLEVSLSEWK